MILITGATGQLGSAIIKNLLETEHKSNLVALVRDTEKAKELADLGVKIKVGNYFDKESLDSAMKDIEKVLLISSSDFNNRLQQHKNVIDAAAQNNVKHIYYTGVHLKNIETSPLKPVLGDHFETEDYIKSKKINYTFLRNNLYMEVLPMFLGQNVKNTGIFLPAKDGKVNFVSREDLAKVTAKIIASENFIDPIYNLCGKKAYSFTEIAEILSHQNQSDIKYTSPEIETFTATLANFGVPEHLIHVTLAFAAGMSNQDFDVTDDTLDNILNNNSTSLENYLKTL
ncbi:MAG: SDR family oxidoreductase [Cytophagales bacterium]